MACFCGTNPLHSQQDFSYCSAVVMNIKEVALSLNTLAKQVAALPDSALKTQLQKQVDAIMELLVSERVKDNEARNFQLTPPEPEAVEPVKSQRSRKPKKTQS